ncbi:MAG: class I SAM-dependent methyltransferase [Colwellia sp.]|nr:class I SAM-dependent methyltransferase [Colwellia sp.]MCW8864269.1 class I SAM-dependent methyltransferase [Colwellia sp.]MCW9082408.1 class I SAM-dependent methyltransferase [Colwellia sp.]
MIQLPEQGELSAVAAKSMAQHIAFSPYIFQATVALKELGILQFIDKNRRKGVLLSEIVDAVNVSEYGVSVLLDFALTCGLVTLTPDESEQDSLPRYGITKVAFFLLHDEMSIVNFDFTQHFGYQGLANLTESIKTGKPEGLKVFGDWPTLYPHLPELPDKTRESWFAFDHFYSDHAFDEILPLVFASQPKHIVDIGGNTGRFTTKCLQYDSEVQMTIMDLPPQLAKAQKNIAAAGFSERFHPFPCDMLDPKQALAKNADVYWMSQFLDCFSEPQIKTILSNIANGISGQQRVLILETFWDAQKFDAAAFSLNATSLYFTCFANGNSRMYAADKFTALVEKSGLKIEQQIDDIGLGHSLLVCSKATN